MTRQIERVWRRIVHCEAVGAPVLALMPVLLISMITCLPAVEDGPEPGPAASPVATLAPTEEELLQQDLARLSGRWERPVPGSKPPLREILIIDGEEDTFFVINGDGALICRYTSQFKLERAGDVRIYNRSKVKLETGKPVHNSGFETQSFIFKFTPGGFTEVSGLLHGRNGSRQQPGVMPWSRAVAARDAADDDDEVENGDEPPADERPKTEPVPQPLAEAPIDPELKRDLELMQGSWLMAGRNAQGEVVWTNQKLVEGHSERVTYFDADGKVTREHTVKFRLEKHGPVRIFTFYDMTAVAGPDAGTVIPDALSFVYKVDGDKFLDSPGSFVSRPSYRDEPGLTVWRRPPSADEVDAELGIERLGGSVTRTTRDEEETTTIQLNGDQFQDEHLRLLKPFKALSELTLVESRVTDAGLKQVSQFANLTRLDLKGTAITDAGLKELVPLKKLKTLSLAPTRITDAGLVELARFKELRQVYLGNTNITDRGTAALAGLKDLTHLGALGTRITDDGLAELSNLGNLKTLFIGGRGITDASVEQFAKFKNLAELNLGNSPITEAGLQRIKQSLPDTNVHR